MIVVQVSPYYPPNIGGLQTVVQKISVALSKKGYEVLVITSRSHRNQPPMERFGTLTIKYLEVFEIGHTPIMPKLFFEILNLPKDAIVHLHAAQPFVPEIVAFATKLRRMPYIVHYHGDVLPSGKLGFLLPFYKKVVLRAVLKGAKFIITPSNDFKNFLVKNFLIQKTKITVIPNGVDGGIEYLSKYKNLKINKTNLLYVGRLVSVKNLPLLIDAIAKVVKFNKNIHLNIVGSGEMEKILKDKVISKDLSSYISMVGTKTGVILDKIYMNSDIFVLCSKKESFGIVLLEAMSHGLPIIASNVIGIRNLIHQGFNGILFRQNSSEDLANKILILIEDERLRKKLIENGFKTAKSHDWMNITIKIEKIYSKI
jgi:glycosyltransferase involved in cell wall biosynthesis